MRPPASPRARCLGMVGLLLTRWEATPATLHYTPNRWLVLVVTFVVSARVLYGLWAIVDGGQSSWRLWHAGDDGVRHSRITGRGRCGDRLLHRVRVGSPASHPRVAEARVARHVSTAARIRFVVEVQMRTTFGSWRAVWDDFRNWFRLGLEARERRMKIA